MARKIEGSGGLDGLAFSRARTPAQSMQLTIHVQELGTAVLLCARAGHMSASLANKQTMKQNPLAGTAVYASPWQPK